MSKKVMPNETVAVHISDFLNYITYANEQHTYNYNEMLEQDAITQDYLHKLELEYLNSSDRSKVARQISICRKKRRGAKDTFEALSPLVEWARDPEVTKVIHKLQEVLGKTRRVERNQQNRMYIPKVLKENTIKGED